MAPTPARKPTKAERTTEAQERARLVREEQQRKERRNGLLAKGGVVLAALVIAAIIVAVVVGNSRGQIPDVGPAPQAGNAQGGVTLVSATELAPTETGDVDPADLPEEPAAAGETPEGIASSADGPVQVVAYVDINCVHCADFEARYADQIRSWLDDGKITFEYRTVAYLDRNSSTAYSSRGANAAACVADSAPQSYFDFTQGLFANFEQGELDDAGLIDLADRSGAGDISTCVEEGTFRPFVKYATSAAQAASVGGTPTVYVNGEILPNGVSDFQPAVQAEIDARG